MRTDDDVQALVGHVLLAIEEKPGPDIDDDDGCHETCFVEVVTSGAFVTLTNHNEHNGWYGDFNMVVTVSNVASELLYKK